MSVAIITIPDLLRVALAPQQVDFNSLHIALQAMVYHLDLSNTKVQFVGEDAVNIQNTINESSNQEVKNISITLMNPSEEEEEEEEEVEEETAWQEDSQDSQKRKKHTEFSEEVLAVESGKLILPSKIKIPSVTPASISRLDRKVKAIQAQVESLELQFLPSDDAILEATRKEQNSEPIRNLLQGLNITKRMSGAEEGLDKLASLLETMAKEYASLKIVIDQLEDQLGQNLVKTMRDIKTAAEYSRKLKPRVELFEHFKENPNPTINTDIPYNKFSEMPKRRSGKKSVIRLTLRPKTTTFSPFKKKKTVLLTGKRWTEASEGSIKDTEPNLNINEPCFKEMVLDEEKESNVDNGNVSEERFVELLQEHKYVMRNMEYLNAELNTMSDYIDAIITKIQSDPTPGTFMDKVREISRKHSIRKSKTEDGNEKQQNKSKQLGCLEERVACLEIQFANNTVKVKRQLAAFCARTNSISVRMNDLEENVATLFKNLSIIVKFKGHTEGRVNKRLLKLITSVMEICLKLKEDFKHMDYTIKTELQLNRQEDHILEECLKQLEQIKVIKADKFEIDEFLASKADCEMLKLKVSVDEFELVCNDFAKGIEDTLIKVSTQEDILKMILNEVHATLNRKCDQEDIEKLKEEFITKLNSLQHAVANVNAAQPPRIAAGGKQKLSPMNCLSCDREIVMKTKNEIPPVPALSDLPPSSSIKPFIAYQLDQLRKLILKNPCERTIFVFDEAMKKYSVKPLDPEQNEISIAGIKNRYCGGNKETKKTKLDCDKIKEILRKTSKR
ncbi:hypothetical protein O3M35_006260 [Rhynocoris fuscipes]|uniref:DUF4795 domain-containing protein n=1 Tax=Rhynocoris fuscipes TaxID=488301 RepID=A0AAW1DDB9_9HEMI